ncbi:hypothetical protein FBULB1_1834 [Fusarium bulbicola]|nr:hypothetical protein FBULB1_1834 [Fusarium bulbicola]
MDPLSITTGCIGLISTICTLSLSVNSFVRTCREARNDLDRVARELLSLQTVLELIKDTIDEDRSFSDNLAYHVSGILANGHSVVLELQGCITKYCNNRLGTKAAWAVSGQGDVAKLRSNLEAHKAALELALDMLALHTAKAIKTDTAEIRNDTSAIKDGSELAQFPLYNVHKNHSEYQVTENDGLSVWECITNVETYYTGIEGEWKDIRSRRRRRAAVVTEQRPRSPSTVPSEFFDAFSLSFYLIMPKDERDGFAAAWFGDELRVESATTCFTALTSPGCEFASQDILRPSHFQPPRRIRIAFCIPVDIFTWPDEFETQRNFISRSVKALTQKVDSPWQNIVVIIEGPPRWIEVDPDILMLFREMDILFETKQSIDYVGRVSLNPP